MRASRFTLAAVFVGAGILHFVRPRMYEAIIPPYLPYQHELVLISGAAEIAGGLGVLVPRLRGAAGLGLIALLIAVFPANVHMAVNPEGIPGLDIPEWALWGRLPLQMVAIAWVWHATLRKR
ncbi:MAG: DoxX family protein [Solirubrobacterales bacterium]